MARRGTIYKKLQAPRSKLQGNIKSQAPKSGPIATVKFGVWSSGAWILVLGAFAVLTTTGCASNQRSPTTNQMTAPLVWPAPPEVARISYVQSVLRPSDIGIKFSPFTRFGHWITGSEKGNEPLLKPFGLALDENDNICLTDTGANAVCYYDRDRKSVV